MIARLFRRPAASATARTTAGERPDAAGPVRFEGTAKQALETGRTRLLVGGALFAVIFAVIGLRVVDLALGRPGGEPRLAVERPAPRFAAGRADIVDRNGTLLATSLRTPSLYADPADVLDADAAAARLARALPDINPSEVAAKLKSDKRFVWIRRNLTPRQQYEINRLGIPGLYFLREERRTYPQGSIVAHIVGLTDVDNAGIAGIEKSFDDVLRGGDRPLPLSIDVRAQHVVRDAVQQQIREFDAIGGAAIVLDATTGEVVAMVSLPDFDPNHPAGTSDDARFNRATLGVYEMGSTFKLFNTAMALDAGTVSVDGGYDASAPIKIARFTITDYKGKNRWLSVPEILVHSSNIGSAKMALDLGTERQREYLARFGMLRPAAVELPEVGAPMLPSPWRKINTMTIAFGHGLSVSPLQLVSGVAALVNGGIMRPPTLLKAEPGRLPAGQPALSERTSMQMRRLMRLVVTEGTGKKADAPGYLVGGKTGSAEKVGAGGGYRRKALLSSFVGAFPMNAPRYVVLVMIDEPKGNKSSHGYATGGWVAAPVVRDIVERIAPLLGVPPADEESPENRRELLVEVSAKGGRRHAPF